MRASILLLAGLLALALTGCDRRLYFPERVNVPLLQNAGDAVVTGSLKIQANSHDSAGGRAANNVTPALDIAFSPVRHIGLMGSYRWQNNRQVAEVRYTRLDLANNFGGTYNGHRWEAGAGYYTALSQRCLFETYAGYGQGTTARHGQMDPDLDFNASYRLLFLQAAFCFTDPDRTKLFLGARLDRIQVTRMTGPDRNIRSKIATSAGGTYMDVTEQPAWTVNPFFGLELPTWVVPLSFQVGLPIQPYGPAPGPRTAFYISLGAGFRYYKDFRQDWQRRKETRRRRKLLYACQP